MALLQQDPAVQEEKDIKAHQEEVLNLKEKLAISRKQTEGEFIDGAITREALSSELGRLDIFRRENTNPVDQKDQALIQGQQNEIDYLLSLEKTLLTEQENIMQRLNEAERELHVLVEAKQRRSEKQ